MNTEISLQEILDTVYSLACNAIAADVQFLTRGKVSYDIVFQKVDEFLIGRVNLDKTILEVAEIIVNEEQDGSSG